ncbi:MAG: DUF4105 domain-containing protein, partial [Bacteriovoracaceae bacterium]|nr:DUF4105 domain-containing protein [Bacteriovoracaceae bacterium]
GFIEDIEKKIPKKMKKAIGREITVDFKWLSKTRREEHIVAPLCNENDTNPQKIGMVRKKLFGKINRIWLDRSVVGTIRRGKNLAIKYECGHRDTYKLAQSALVHEIAHLYDFSGVRQGTELAIQKYCRDNVKIDTEMEGRKIYPKGCWNYRSNSRAVSKSPYFLNMAGWISKGTVWKRRVQLNHALIKSPDSYEFENAEESFAVNMEFFILCPEYRERRPVWYKYFAGVFGERPNDNSKAQKNMYVSVSSAAMVESPLANFNLDLSRLYEIDYLFAGEGQKMMSRWGHALFRLVFCKPGRKMGPKCRLDLGHHLVVSYRAEISDYSIDYLKGLTGAYDSRPYLLMMVDVIDEYTKEQSRKLVSVPMKFSNEQKSLFIDRLLEQYWAYRGKYYFLSNNCATETVNHLRLLEKNSPEFQVKNVFSPKGVYDFLQSRDLLDMSVLDDLKKAESRGYYFPPYYEKIVPAFNYLKKQMSKMKYKDALDITMNSDAIGRKEVMDFLLEKITDEDERGRLIANLLKIEEYILVMKKLRFRREVGDFLLKAHGDGNIDTELFQLVDKYKKILLETLPENLISSGYGVPLVEEYRSLSQDDIANLSKNLGKVFDDVKIAAKNHFSDTISEIEKIVDSCSRLRYEMAKTFGLVE